MSWLRHLAAPAWGPASMPGVWVWLNAADTNTLTLIDNRVSQWADSSGNNRNFTQTTLSAQPYITAVSGYNCPDFRGAQWLLTNSGFATNGGFYVVSVVSQSAGAWPALVAEKNGSSRGYLALGQDNTGYLAISRSGQATATSALAKPTGLAIVSYESSNGIVSGSVSVGIRVNGNTPSVVSIGSLLSGTGTDIGASRSGAQDFLTGAIAELIVSSNPSSAVRQCCEGYLAHKWGLASALGSDHPYKSGPP